VAPVEQARSWDRLMSSQKLTHRELAAKLGYDHTMINKSLALLDLPAAVQAQVDDGTIAASTGTLIARVADPAEQQALADRVVAEGLSRAEVAEAVRRAGREEPRRAATRTTGKGGGAAKKGRGAGKLVTSRTFKGESGLRLVAERARGVEPAALLAVLEAAAETVRAELGPSA
jgi:ParB family transcriptional regulator, chromosome partitioning protein